MNLIQIIQKTMRRLTPLERAARELDDALLAKLDADSACDYALANSIYNEARIERLRAYIKAAPPQ